MKAIRRGIEDNEMLEEVRSRVKFDEVTDIKLTMEVVPRRVLERNPSGIEPIDTQNIAMLLTKLQSSGSKPMANGATTSRSIPCCYYGQQGVDFRTHKGICPGKDHICSKCGEPGHLEVACEQGAARREYLAKPRGNRQPIMKKQMILATIKPNYSRLLSWQEISSYNQNQSISQTRQF